MSRLFKKILVVLVTSYLLLQSQADAATTATAVDYGVMGEIFEIQEKDLVEVKTMALLIKTEFKSSSDLLNQKVDYLEKRVHNIELTILKHSENEK
mgnify:CR=1 FL=1